MTEKELIEKCKKANPLAQRELMNRYAPALYSVALRYAVDRQDAKDILQESFIKIYNHLDSYNEQGKFKAWMTKITVNTALRNRTKLSYKNSVSVDSFYNEPSEENMGLEELKYDDLLRLINALPDTLREVLKMAIIDDMSHREIAELLNIEESTSRAHLSRARRKLQELIDIQNNVECYE